MSLSKQHQYLEGKLPVQGLPLQRQFKETSFRRELWYNVIAVLKMICVGVGEMAQWLRALVALAKELNSVPSTHMANSHP